MEKLSAETAEVKRGIQLVIGKTRGEEGRGRQRAHTARSVEATSGLVATKRTSAALDVVPVWSRVVAPPTYRRSIYPYFQFTDATTSTVLACDGLVDSAANSK